MIYYSLMRNKLFCRSPFNSNLFCLEWYIPHFIFFYNFVYPSTWKPWIDSLWFQGWGSSQLEGNRSQVLTQAEIPIAHFNICAKANEKFGKVEDRLMICAGYGGNSNISGCHGDSGGPLVCQDEETGRWTLRGTVSWGDHYCRGGPTYSVFVRISSYIDWIKCKMTSRPLQPRKFNLSISSTIKQKTFSDILLP